MFTELLCLVGIAVVYGLIVRVVVDRGALGLKPKQIGRYHSSGFVAGAFAVVSYFAVRATFPAANDDRFVQVWCIALLFFALTWPQIVFDHYTCLTNYNMHSIGIYAAVLIAAGMPRVSPQQPYTWQTVKTAFGAIEGLSPLWVLLLLVSVDVVQCFLRWNVYDRLMNSGRGHRVIHFVLRDFANLGKYDVIIEVVRICAVVGVIWSIGGAHAMAMERALWGMAVGYLLFIGIMLLSIALFRRIGIGTGDGDYLAMAGAFLGWEGALTTLFIGVMIALPYVGVRRKVLGDKNEGMPLVPGLGVAAIIVFLAGPAIRFVPLIVK